ncbi:MAG: hypothetical protein GMKNLPBB_01962 [Myxococcota bacterium]|nr:hypothetical protein [Myxococcota bacterium]
MKTIALLSAFLTLALVGGCAAKRPMESAKKEERKYLPAGAKCLGRISVEEASAKALEWFDGTVAGVYEDDAGTPDAKCEVIIDTPGGGEAEVAYDPATFELREIEGESAPFPSPGKYPADGILPWNQVWEKIQPSLGANLTLKEWELEWKNNTWKYKFEYTSGSEQFEILASPTTGDLLEKKKD